MGDYAYFYNSNNGDREYDADSMTDWLRPFFTTGVFNGSLQVIANDNMTVSIAGGYCNIKGKTKNFKNVTTFELETASGTLNRIDNVILRRDDIERDIYLMVQKGGNAETPKAPELTRTDSIYDLKLAEIYITAGTITITQANITDKRMDADVCGWVASTVEEIDLSQLPAQFEAFFQEWFEKMKGQLSEDAAGNLQNQIEVERQRINNLASLKEGSTTGDAELQDVKVGYDGTIYKNAGEAVRGQIGQLSSEIVDVKDSFITKNVFNPSNSVHGYYVGDSTILNELDIACYTPIKVKGENGTLKISLVNFSVYPFGENVGIIGTENLEKLVHVTGHRVENETIVYTGEWTNRDDMYFYVNCAIDNKENFAVYINKEETEFTPFNVSTLREESFPKKLLSNLYGKKLCCNGDSIMYGAGATGGFAKIIADEYDMELQNIAISGGTIASGTTFSNNVNRHWIAETINNLNKDGDYYIIEGGINDYNLNVPLYANGQTEPRINISTTKPTDISNLCDAMESLCYDLVNNYTTKKVGFLFTHKIGYFDWTTNTKGYTFLEAKQMQKKVLRKWGIPYLDLSEVTSMVTIFPEIANLYTDKADRCHPNELGYKTFYVPKIVKWLESL